MDIALKSVLSAQSLGNPHKTLHGVIRIFKNPRTQKQPFDVISPIKLHGQIHHFFNGKSSARRVITTSRRTISAVIDAVVGK